jgi:hypothetical protein
MRSGTGNTSGSTGGVNNPYVCAVREGAVGRSRVHKGCDAAILGYPAARPRKRTVRQMRSLRRACVHTKRCQSFNRGAAEFLMGATPTVGDLIDHTQDRHGRGHRLPPRCTLLASSVKIARANLAAQESVLREYTAGKTNGQYGHISAFKPDDLICIMHKNFSSLSLFSTGLMHHKKICQLNKLMSDYSVDILAGCKTRMDWHFITNKNDRFCNLFGRGLQTRSICGSNVNN